MFNRITSHLITAVVAGLAAAMFTIHLYESGEMEPEYVKEAKQEVQDRYESEESDGEDSEVDEPDDG